MAEHATGSTKIKPREQTLAGFVRSPCRSVAINFGSFGFIRFANA